MPNTIPAAGEAVLAREAQVKAENRYQQGPFRQIADMETPLETIRAMLRGLAMLAETMEEEHAHVVQQMAWYAIEKCDKISDLRSEAWKLTHPNRDHFETEGWPK